MSSPFMTAHSDAGERVEGPNWDLKDSCWKMLNIFKYLWAINTWAIAASTQVSASLQGNRFAPIFADLWKCLPDIWTVAVISKLFITRLGLQINWYALWLPTASGREAGEAYPLQIACSSLLRSKPWGIAIRLSRSLGIESRQMW